MAWTPAGHVKIYKSMRFTFCATRVNILCWLCCSICHPSCTSWLTDISCSQRWVIYSQTNGAASNYTYLFRFVWFVIVFSDLLFCFRICDCVFWLVIMFSELLLSFLIIYFFFCICVCNLLFCFQNRDLFCTSRPLYYKQYFKNIDFITSLLGNIM